MTEMHTSNHDLGDNYRRLKTALIDRITRRYQALVRLSPDMFDARTIESRLAIVGDDADALLQLFDDVERRLDQAFAAQARRGAPKRSAEESEPRGPDPTEFQSK